MIKKGLCMDFDGVFVDSTNECIEIALKAFKKNFDDSIENLDIEKLKAIRPMVKGAGEYLFGIRLLTENRLFKNIKHSDFDRNNFNNIFTDNQINLFIKCFYQERKNLILKNKAKWIDSHLFFDKSFELIKKWNTCREVKFSIISLKDKESIKILLSNKGYNNIEIIDKSEISYKPDGLNFFSKKYKLPKENIFFVDDNPLHLNQCLISGFKNVYMPSWNKTCLNYAKFYPHLKFADNNLIDNFLSKGILF